MRKLLLATVIALAPIAAFAQTVTTTVTPSLTASGTIGNGVSFSGSGQFGTEAGGTIAGGSNTLTTGAAVSGYANTAEQGSVHVAPSLTVGVAGSGDGINGTVTGTTGETITTQDTGSSNFAAAGLATPGASFTSTDDAFSQGDLGATIDNNFKTGSFTYTQPSNTTVTTSDSTGSVPAGFQPGSPNQPVSNHPDPRSGN